MEKIKTILATLVIVFIFKIQLFSQKESKPLPPDLFYKKAGKVEVITAKENKEIRNVENDYNAFLDTLSKYSKVSATKYSEFKNHYEKLKTKLIDYQFHISKINKLELKFQRIAIVLNPQDTVVYTTKIKTAPPFITLPFPIASAQGEVDLSLFKNSSTYYQINEKIETTFKNAGIKLSDLRYFLLKEDNEEIGYAVMTPLEVIETEGRHIGYLHTSNSFDIFNFSFSEIKNYVKKIIKEITFQNTNYIRCFFITVTCRPTIITDGVTKPNLDSLNSTFIKGTPGFFNLGLPYHTLTNYSSSILVYEFKKTQFNDVSIVQPIRLDLKTHLKAYNLEDFCR